MSLRKFIIGIEDFLKISGEISEIKKKLGENGQKVECTFVNKDLKNNTQLLWVEGPPDILDDFANKISEKEFFIGEDYWMVKS